MQVQGKKVKVVPNSFPIAGKKTAAGLPGKHRIGITCLFFLLSIVAHAWFLHFAMRLNPPHSATAAKPQFFQPVSIVLSDLQRASSSKAAEGPSARTGAVPSRASAAHFSSPPETASSPLLPIMGVREIRSHDISQVLLENMAAETEGLPVAGYFESGEVDRRVRATADFSPLYPRFAYEFNRAGRVLVEFLISEQGHMDSLKLLAATPGFESRTLEAFQRMTFEPAYLRGKTVPSRLLIVVDYELVDSAAGRSNRDNLLAVEPN